MSITLRKVLSRLMLYLGLAFGFLAACGLVAWLLIRTGSKLPPGRWIGFVCMTPVIFWAPLTQLKRHWHKARLWLAAMGLLAIHIALFTVVLLDYPNWRPAWFTLLAFPEAWLIYLVLYSLAVEHRS